MIVSNIAGTTRDAIDTKVTWNKKDYIFIDTAGLRRKGKVKEEIERYSVIRTVTAVERADVVVVVIDASEGVTEQDAKIAGIAHDRGKGIIVAVNKWDAIEKNDKTIYKHTEKIRQILSFMPYAQIIFISAKTGQRLPKLFENIDTVIENQTLRIQTGVLNEILSEAVALQQPPSDRGRRLKIFYMTQVAVKPPTFVIFVNDKELMHFSYVRYLENKIRDAFGFSGNFPEIYHPRARGKGIKVWNVLFVLLSVMYAGFFRQAILLEKSTRQISEIMAAGMRVLRMPFGPLERRREHLPCWETA